MSELQLMDSKSAELERLLSQLSDVNDSMRNALGGRNDTRAHTLTRHRDILHDYQQVPAAQAFPARCALQCRFEQIRCNMLIQEFRRHATSLGASRDRVQLLRGSTDRSPLLGGPSHNASGALLRERGQISGANSAVSSQSVCCLNAHMQLCHTCMSAGPSC